MMKRSHDSVDGNLPEPIESDTVPTRERKKRHKKKKYKFKKSKESTNVKKDDSYKEIVYHNDLYFKYYRVCIQYLLF